MPDAHPRQKKRIANRILTLADGKDQDAEDHSGTGQDLIVIPNAVHLDRSVLHVSFGSRLPASDQRILRRGGLLMGIGLFDEVKVLRLISDEQQIDEIEFWEAQEQFCFLRHADGLTRRSRERWKRSKQQRLDC